MGDRATIDMGRKEGGCCASFAGELGPRLTQCGLGRSLLPYQVASSSIQPFLHKTWAENWGLCPFYAPFISSLIMCYNVVFGLVDVKIDDFFSIVLWLQYQAIHCLWNIVT